MGVLFDVGRIRRRSRRRRRQQQQQIIQHQVHHQPYQRRSPQLSLLLRRRQRHYSQEEETQDVVDISDDRATTTAMTTTTTTTTRTNHNTTTTTLLNSRIKSSYRNIVANAFEQQQVASSLTKNYSSSKISLYQTTNPNNDTTNNNIQIMSPLRISGIITLIVTTFIYITLHVLAAKERRRLKEEPKQGRSMKTQRHVPLSTNDNNNANNITTIGDDTYQKSTTTTQRSPQQKRLSSQQHGERIYTSMDNEGENNNNEDTKPSSVTVAIDAVEGPILTGTTTVNVVDNSSYRSITPVVTDTTATPSTSIVDTSCCNNDSSSSHPTIPQTIVAKQKKKRTKAFSKSSSHSQSIPVMSRNATTDVELAILGPHDEHDDVIDCQSRNINIANINDVLDSTLLPDVVQSNYRTDVDNETYFYQPRITTTITTTASQFNHDHYSQRENITLPNSALTTTTTPTNRSNEDVLAEMDPTFVVMSATSLWVSNEDSFIHHHHPT